MKSKSILFSILATAALTACHNDENISNGTDHGAASFTASINGPQVTRAYDTSWDANDRIGITGKSGDTQYTNVAYETLSADGKFTVVPPSTEIYYQDDAVVTFTAYYPYTENGNLAEGTKITADTKLQGDQKKFDFLHATATGSKANSEVSFSFTHRMAKVSLTIHKGSGVEFSEVKAAALALQGFKNNGSFDITSGEATATGDALTSSWTFAGNTDETNNNAPSSTNNEGETVTYTLILFPQAFDAALPFSATLTDRQTFNAEIDFTAANTDAGDVPTGNYLTAGRQYNLSVTLNKTGITVDGCSIEQWQTANGGNVDAN